MDTIDKRRRTEVMSSIRSKDTKPEKRIRRLLHRLGYRFRLHRKDLPGHPDVVLPRYKAVVLVHGCFWHGCEKCDRGTRVPKTNTDFWVRKVAENRRRDQEVMRRLQEAGWNVILVWACQCDDTAYLTDLFARALPRTPPGRPSTSSRGAAG
jgi:DNA mismatch endonuclease (patch repair protein)